jgi:uncharacterized iron-regulated protein
MPKALDSLTLLIGIAFGVGSAAAITACSRGFQADPPPHRVGAMPAPAGVAMVDPDDAGAVGDLIGYLRGKRAVFVGETHDRYDHHLNQLAIIRGLRDQGADLAIGMEFFQEPFQPHLDAYVAGEIDEKQLLKRTEYYDRWRYDYRLYRDILVFARENGIPLIALNAPTELVAKVSQNGVAGLSPQDRGLLPEDLAEPGSAYLDRLRPIFEMHGNVSEERFRRFAEVQMLWDEHMARVARDYLAANPENTMVVLAGSGHVAYPDAIPGRLARMLPGDYAVIATGPEERHAGGRVDFLLAERDIALPSPGRMGLMLASKETGVTIAEVPASSPAADAGFRPGDRVLSIAGERVRGMDDVRLALLDRSAGEQVWVEVARGGLPANESREGRALTLM